MVKVCLMISHKCIDIAYDEMLQIQIFIELISYHVMLS